jgi:hypothetical protein
MAKYIKLFFSLFLMAVLTVIFISCSLFETKPDDKKIIKESSPPPAEKPGLTYYLKGCGQCHIPYPPHFLPSGSWDRILGSTEKHFGERLDIDRKTKDIILTYLKENSAESSKDAIPQKIMQSLEGKTPLRLTEVPFILKKHRRYPPVVLKSKSLGSLAQCNSCHRSADKWKF